MARFNRDLIRRHSTAPSYQRNFPMDAPPAQRDWDTEEQYWRGPPPNRERPYWRGPPLDREGHYWRDDSSQDYNKDRGRPYYRNCHPYPNQGEPVALDRDHISHPQSSHRTNRRRHRGAHPSTKIMVKKKGHASQTVEANATDPSQINLTDKSTAPSSKPKRKRPDPGSSSDKIISESAASKGAAYDEEDRAQHGSDSENDVERTISAACTYLQLDRGQKLMIKASSSTAELTCTMPVVSSQLTRRIVRYGGFQNQLWDPPEKNSSPTTMVILDPILDEALVFSTETLAQEFIRCPEKRWLHEEIPKLCVGIPYHEKYFIWARMMLLEEEDKKFMDLADVSRGVFSSLFHIPTVWPLIQAFLDFWNVKGHTIVTSQGEMGYSLLLVSDAMGIPISGRAYDEYVPLQVLPGEDEVVRTLHGVFAKLCKLKLSRASTGKGLVRIEAWLDYFLADKRRNRNISETSLPFDHYAPLLDPLLKNYGFHVALSEGKNPSALFSGYRVDYRARHSRLEYRAAFIATWLCMYCVPIDGGLYIRPEVFTAAASIARGTKTAIGIASLANLYSCLDNVYRSIVGGDRSASEFDLPLPIHFIMGWFAAYWKSLSKPPTCPITFVERPPFVVDCGRASQLKIDIISAHKIFLVTDECQCLRHLDFIGRQGPIHFTRQAPLHLNDNREARNNGRSLKNSEIDLITSSMIGGVSHRRCQFQNNQVYCPHRFARSHNCDQEVPDFFMDGKLQFSDYLKGTLEETTSFLTLRLFGYLRSGGHNFELLPKTRPTHCTYEYMKWCTSALSFLQQLDIFATAIAAPHISTSKATASILRPPYSSPKHISGAPTEQANKTIELLATSDEESPVGVPTKRAKKAAESPVTSTKKTLVMITPTKNDKVTVSPVASTRGSPVVATTTTTRKDKKTTGCHAVSTKDAPVVATRTKMGKKATEPLVSSPKEDLVVMAVAGTQSDKSASKSNAEGSISVPTQKEAMSAAGTGMMEVPVQDMREQASMLPVNSPTDLGVMSQIDDDTCVATGIDEPPAEENTGVHDDDDHDSETAKVLSSGKNEQPAAKLPERSKKGLKKSLKGNWNTTRRIDRLTKIKESTQGAVQQFVEETTNVFDSSILPSAPKKFDQSPGAPLCLPESACTKTKLGFEQIVSGLRALQALANADNFSQKSFLDAITSNLDVWENFFSSYFTEEIKVMVAKLQSLRRELSEEPDQQPHSIDVSERTKQVNQLLEKATSIKVQLVESRSQVDKNKLDGEKRQQLLDTFEVSITNNIQELEAQLASEKESLELVRSHKAEMLTFFQVQETVCETINAGSNNLKQTISKGESLSKQMDEFQRAEDNSALPGPVQALRNLIKEYRIEA